MSPATCRINGAKSTRKLSVKAQKLVVDKNTPHNTLGAVIGFKRGWVNKGEWPLVEQLTFEDNIVDVLKIERGRAYIRVWKGETDDPCVIHNWHNIDQEGKMYGPQNPRGDGIGYIVLDYPEGVWIPLDRLAKV
jgi:hypothetical protein